MTSKSKIKGSAYERDVARLLSDLYGAQFMRNISGSGAFIGGTNVHRKQNMTAGQIRNSKGDIVPPDEWTYFNCECKSYADLAWHQLCNDGACTQLEAWLAQLLAVGDERDLNILFFKITRKGEWVAVQSHADWNTSASHIRYHSSRGWWYIFNTNEFFKLNSDAVKRYSIGGV
jgi:hypothetical protein